MLLTFSKDDFVQKIIDRTKIHTIRADKNGRWKVGMKIHFWRGNPRNVKSHPYAFGEGTCSAIDKFDFIKWGNGQIIMRVNGTDLDRDGMEKLAINDGFKSLEEMTKWFFPYDRDLNEFRGRKIWWDQSTVSFFKSETNSNQLKLL